MSSSKTWDTLEPGDHLTLGMTLHQQHYKVIDVLPNSAIIQYMGPGGKETDLMVRELALFKENPQWSIRGEQKVTLTLNEIADKFNINVSNLRIKE